MISRAQRILFLAMLIATVTMATILIRLRERTQDRLRAVQTSTVLIAPTDAPTEPVTLLIPNDADASLLQSQRNLPLPRDTSARARVLIETLLEAFHEPHSTHPINGIPENSDSAASPAAAPGIDEIFLMPIPQPRGAPAAPGQMAVINFSSAFAQSHPSGIEPETLTLLSIIGTIHANLPEITQVRFLIDGHQADTLAGHADLTRVYLASDPNEAGGQP